MDKDNSVEELVDVRTCDKCKEVFNDIHSFFTHKTRHCTADDGTMKLVSLPFTHVILYLIGRFY